MPKVGKKNYSYDKEGMMEAKRESMKTGIPISNSAQRNMQTYPGGGKTGYNVPMYKEGGKTRMKDEDMILDIKNKEKVKAYEDRFKTKEEKAKQKARKVAAPLAKKRKRKLPKKGKKPLKALSKHNMSDKEFKELMDSQQKYKKGGKVDKATKKAIKKQTKVKVSLKDARNKDIQEYYGTEGKPFKTRRAIKKKKRKQRKELMIKAKKGNVKLTKSGSLMTKKNGGKVKY